MSTPKRETGDEDRTYELAALRGGSDGSIVGQGASQPVVSLLWDGGAATVPLPEREPCVIGRVSDADIQIDTRSVSRRHALLHHSNGLAIEDLGSANGTRVRGRTLGAGERVAIEPNEPVMIGSALLVVRSSGLASAATPVKAEERPRSRRDGPPSKPGPKGADDGPMADVELLVSLVAPTDMSVFLLGETGAGKGHFARKIHERSRRAAGPFLHLNCAALPENLLESELFGHERGAFSGAAQAKPGLLESAERGTVFLDEIGEIPLSIQAKLLVAIERREVHRIGALKPRPLDVRFISATNRASSAQEIVGLRPDLYFRLAGMPISIPPLRERSAEIPGLAAGFVIEAALRVGREPPTLSPGALQALMAYSWPGNVRELATVIDRALLFCGDTLLEGDLRLAPPAPSSRRAQVEEQPPAPPRTLPAEYEAIERRRIIEVLDACGGNQSRAAAMLGISRRTLVTRIEEFGLPRPRKR